MMPSLNADPPHVVSDTIPTPRMIALDAPWRWLAAGWQDMWGRPAISLTYGIAFALAAALLGVGLYYLDALPVFLVLAGGFLLIGPLMAVGLYELSRRLARGEPVGFADIILAPVAARGQLAFAGILLLLVYLFWVRLAFLLLMLFLGGSAIPTPGAFTQLLLFTPQGLGLLIAGTIAGAMLATLVFTTSALALPLLATKRVDVLTASAASVSAVLRNPKPMALWAALVAGIMAVGFATLLLGLIVAFPLLGHATWHAYEEVLGDRS
jgi:uncharacterized membrane protein